MRFVCLFLEYGNVVEVRINVKSVFGKVLVSRLVVEFIYFFIMYFLFCCFLRFLFII